MIKPIFVIRFPIKHKFQAIEKLIYGDTFKDIKEQYNIVFLIDEFSDSIQFECHNADLNENVKIEDLQERLIILMESALHRIRQKSITEEIKKQEEANDDVIQSSPFMKQYIQDQDHINLKHQNKILIEKYIDSLKNKNAKTNKDK